MTIDHKFHGTLFKVGYREIPESTSSLKKILRNVIEAETEEKANSSLDVLQASGIFIYTQIDV